MNQLRPFRFGVVAYSASSPVEWREKARRAEALGYDTFLVPDHLGGQLGAIPAIAAAAESTRTIRVGSFVLNAAFRHPVVLAQDAATLDLLSDGRLELGLGAGHVKSEHEVVGIPYEAPATRIERLFEAVRVIKTLLTEDPASFSGRHYRVSGLAGLPRATQRPHPPILVGGGGRALLRFAAREADIVSVVPRSTPEGLDTTDFGWASFEEKLSWVRSAATDRPRSPELNTLVQTVKVSGDRVAAARELAKEWSVDEELVLDSPYVLIGTVEEVANAVWNMRERHGVSYISVFEDQLDRFAGIFELVRARERGEE